MQARIRGNLVMALSNKFGWLVLTTGNKSEVSVGYATLYGDMAGGFAVLKDVYKGLVYRLVRWRNEQAGRELVPASVLERPPSAELRHDQRDDDSLRAARGLHRGGPRRGRARPPRAACRDVERVIAMVDRSEYKRRQARRGSRSHRGVRRDRRLPITNRYVSRVARGRSCRRRVGVEVCASPLARAVTSAPSDLDRGPRPSAGRPHSAARRAGGRHVGAPPSHFWLVLAAAVTSARLALSTSGIALHRADARLFLVSLAFLSAAGFLALHALATPGVLLDGPTRASRSPPRSGCWWRPCSRPPRRCRSRPSGPSG